MAAKWTQTFALLHPPQGRLHPHALQGVSEFRALWGTCPHCHAPTAMPLSSARPHVTGWLPPAPIPGGKETPYRRPRRLSHWYPEIHPQVRVFDPHIFLSFHTRHHLLLLTSWVINSHFLRLSYTHEFILVREDALQRTDSVPHPCNKFLTIFGRIQLLRKTVINISLCS